MLRGGHGFPEVPQNVPTDSRAGRRALDQRAVDDVYLHALEVQPADEGAIEAHLALVEGRMRLAVEDALR